MRNPRIIHPRTVDNVRAFREKRKNPSIPLESFRRVPLTRRDGDGEKERHREYWRAKRANVGQTRRRFTISSRGVRLARFAPVELFSVFRRGKSRRRRARKSDRGYEIHPEAPPVINCQVAIIPRARRVVDGAWSERLLARAYRRDINRCSAGVRDALRGTVFLVTDDTRHGEPPPRAGGPFQLV